MGVTMQIENKINIDVAIIYKMRTGEDYRCR
jgi:hypothetical protein